MNESLPEGWAATTLGEICSKPQYGWTCRASTDGSIKYVRTTDISPGSIDWDGVPYCGEVPDDMEKYRVQPDDILVSRAGSVGVSYRIKGVPFKAVFASYLIRFKALDAIPPQYVEFFLKSDEYWHSISEFTAGIAIPNVNASKLASLELPLPPLPEQRRIVAKLEQLLDRVNASQKRLERIPIILKRFRQSVLAAACSGKLTEDWRGRNPDVEPATAILTKIAKDQGESKHRSRRSRPAKEGIETPFDIPDTWTFCQFDDIAAAKPNAIKAGPFGSSLTKGCYVSSGFKVYGQEQVINGDPYFGSYYITEEKFRELQACEVSAGDVLVSLVGTIGKVLVMPSEFQPGVINPRLAKFSLHQLIPPEYVARYLLSPLAMSMLTEESHGGTMEILNLRILRRLPIPLAPIPEQWEIVRRVEALFALADQIEARYTKAKTHVDRLTQSILARAFRGELVPQDPNDEPASVLLERIRATRVGQSSNPTRRSSRGMVDPRAAADKLTKAPRTSHSGRRS